MTIPANLPAGVCALALLPPCGPAQPFREIELSGACSCFRLPREEDSGLTAAGFSGWQAALALRFRRHTILSGPEIRLLTNSRPAADARDPRRLRNSVWALRSP
jgi:hypothetical protein